jgi:hypothetical protein
MDLNDWRVDHSRGGGWSPEQHYGVLRNGVPFYFRMRHNSATLKIGFVGMKPEELPVLNPRYENQSLAEDLVAALYPPEGAALLPYKEPYWWGPIGHVEPYEDYDDQGAFLDDETRQRSFTECLNQVEEAGYGQGLPPITVEGDGWAVIPS